MKNMKKREFIAHKVANRILKLNMNYKKIQMVNFSKRTKIN